MRLELARRRRGPRAGPRPRARAPPTIVVAAHEVQHRGAALLPAAATSSASSAGSVERPLAQQRRARRRRRRCPSTVGLHAAAGDRPEVGRRRDRRRGRWAAATIARASGCSLSDSTAPARRSTSSSPMPGAGDADDGVLALGERAGLVEQERVDGAALLEREAVLDEDPVAGRHRRGDRRRQRDRQAERVRAGDDQHGHDPGDRLVGVAERQPHDAGDHRGAGGDVEEQRGGPVGEHLRPRPRLLGLGHQPLDAGQRGVLADRVDPHPDRRVGRHRAGDDPVADVLGDRLGLAGDHRLVELRRALDDLAVGRHPGAGADQHDVTDAQVVDRRPSRRSPSGSDPLGLVGQQRGERGEGVLGLAERLHLLPVAEQHDRHQQRQLPPEVQVERVERRRHRRARRRR